MDLSPALMDYYQRHLAKGTFVSWLAMDGDKIIGTSGMSFVEKPPYFGCPTGRIGLLSSMYTNPDYRRKGIARELLRRLWKKRGLMVVVRFRLPHQIWAYCCILILVLLRIRILCNTSYRCFCPKLQRRLYNFPHTYVVSARKQARSLLMSQIFSNFAPRNRRL